MLLKNSIDNLIAEAMKSHNNDRLNTLRLIKNQLLILEKSGQPYNEESEIKVLMKMSASHEDSIKQFKDAGRIDLVENEEKELNIIKEFIPKQPSDEEVEEYVKEVIQNYLTENKISTDDIDTKHIKPIMDIVKRKYNTPNVGKIVSTTIKNKTF